MWILYSLVVWGYGRAIRFASLFNDKARKWVTGRSNWSKKMRDAIGADPRKRIWFHCASLGEFEQGRPVMEAMRKEYPDHLLVLTFFSPSGYEVRKKDPIADYVWYLPLDGPSRSKKFISLLNPSLVFFVKYEFWYFYGKELHRRKIPYFCISAIFRPGQVFFHATGDFFRKMLTRHTQLFVQDQESLQLLYKSRITNVTVSGDTRFDRVFTAKENRQSLPEIEAFCKDHFLFVCGSTWPADEAVLLPLINKQHAGVKYIIAPHEISEQALHKLESSLQVKSCRYAQWKQQQDPSVQVLIIDHVGLLSRLYQYAGMAYIGGGFGVGIHNILEASVYGVPVLFGPNYEKFREARELVSKKAAFSISNASELNARFIELRSSPQQMEKIKSVNLAYIDSKRGATKTIMSYLEVNYLG